MGAAVGLSYLAGFVIAWVVLYQRAGFPDVDADWREFVIPNLPWFAFFVIKFWFWPATLSAWLVEGRPPSRWRAVTELEGRPTRKIIRVAVPGPAGSYNKH